MTQDAAKRARECVSEWLRSSGATANSDWLYQDEEDGLVALVTATIDAAVAEAVARKDAFLTEAAAEREHFRKLSEQLAEAVKERDERIAVMEPSFRNYHRDIAEARREEREALIHFFTYRLSASHSWTAGAIEKAIRDRDSRPASAPEGEK